MSFSVNKFGVCKMKKKSFLLVLMFIVLFCLVSCKGQNALVKENAQIVADAFTDNDMETINKIIFKTDHFEVDEALWDIWGESTQSQEGILTYIFELVTVKVKNITDSTIEYEIEAPDMSNMFATIDINTENFSEEELLEHIKSYAQNAGTKTTAVSLKYVLVDDELVVNYRNEEFINAVTGGLLDAYKSLYSEIMEEYSKWVN